MQRLGVQTIRTGRTLLQGSRLYTTAPAQEQVVSPAFKVQDHKDFHERVMNSKVPVIVDFFATWCNPCRMLTPRIETVVAEKQGKILLAKVDIDENTDLALDYHVGSVPVLIAMKDGKVLERIVGLQDTDKLRQFVNKYTE
ncbi:PREDICTED: thioredoxin, mitochondrial [Wasmannia auropunctata]|uniref:thioredoxin, mitochondrial n=1 Tax=Wasmannia auropunctata TaxID=64793 RepID=UPI0005EDF63F|nr:PREDICTED: thioredoxin, mitochondrial [Wasmannia auropunctata]XP_011695390.1 PREDICTED: thioredoxin, mitochondrial [Wasmannia auropunctata]XP_011695391.1 PREDICTED: thioredoxin, mitochondrial [Wasmannia auropunctata]